MSTLGVLISLIGVTAYIFGLYYMYQTYKNSVNNKETALRYLMIKKEFKRALKLLIAGSMIFIVGYITAVGLAIIYPGYADLIQLFNFIVWIVSAIIVNLACRDIARTTAPSKS